MLTNDFNSAGKIGLEDVDIYCVVQFSMEGRLKSQDVQRSLASRELKPSGDMISWCLVEQFQDEQFASLAGARIVRIATHPDVQGMGYGSKAMDLVYK